MSKTVEVAVTRFETAGKSQAAQDEIACEMALTIFLNGVEILTTLCSPDALDFLAAGILESEGLIAGISDIRSIKIKAEESSVHIETCPEASLAGSSGFKPLIASGGGKGSSGYNLRHRLRGVCDSGLTVSPQQINTLMEVFLTRSSAYNSTHGVHSAALCDGDNILLFQDDIGRHNALDKIFGECLMKAIPLSERVMLTSGRISSEVLLKVARHRVPVLISKAAPTNLGAILAQETGITLLRATKQGAIIAYSHPERVAHSSEDGLNT